MFSLKKNTKKIGQYGEDLAAQFLRQKGYKIIERNFSVQGGEIDIIAQKSSMLVFVEVKTRKNDVFGTPAMAVNFGKRQKIIHTALIFLHINNHHGACRFDVIEVYLKDNKKTINHIQNAFEFTKT